MMATTTTQMLCSDKCVDVPKEATHWICENMKHQR